MNGCIELIDKWKAIEIVLRHKDAFKDSMDVQIALDCIEAAPAHDPGDVVIVKDIRHA